ncbi:MAG: sigma-70 family RNA polymerase sigma factor [Planctomycetota bacterium]
MDEKELLNQARQGDRHAFAGIVELYQARLRAYAVRYVPNSDDVYDLVQDAFLDAFRHLDRFDPTRDFAPWLRAICLNRVRNHFRAQRRQQNAARNLVDQALAGQIDDEPDEGDALERISALRQCVGELKEDHREIIQLRYHGGIAVKDIADQLQKSAASISMLIMRVKAMLHKCMETRIGKAQA